jgi:hypothetical protein
VFFLLCTAKKVVESTSNKLQFLIDELELDYIIVITEQ